MVYGLGFSGQTQSRFMFLGWVSDGVNGIQLLGLTLEI